MRSDEVCRNVVVKTISVDRHLEMMSATFSDRQVHKDKVRWSVYVSSAQETLTSDVSPHSKIINSSVVHAQETEIWPGVTFALLFGSHLKCYLSL